MIDLHLHTTASDGRSTPAELVSLAAAAGLKAMAVTDHDTVAACVDAARFADREGIVAIAGIEITAVDAGRDVHMLGYFIDITDPDLSAFLAAQRAIRVERAHAIVRRLTELGMPVDLTPFITGAASGARTVGRPQVADALIAAGHVPTRRAAFDLWLGAGKPAFVARDGAPPEAVIRLVHSVGGVISLAHPGRTGLGDERIAQLAAAGLDAIEVYHPDHDPALVAHYSALADRLELLRTGGSDFHGDPAYSVAIGAVWLPEQHWQRLHDAGSRRS